MSLVRIDTLEVVTVILRTVILSIYTLLTHDSRKGIGSACVHRVQLPTLTTDVLLCIYKEGRKSLPIFKVF